MSDLRVREGMPDSDKRAFAWPPVRLGVTALRLIRELKKAPRAGRGLSWQQAVTEAGKMLTTIVADPAGLPGVGEGMAHYGR